LVDDSIEAEAFLRNATSVKELSTGAPNPPVEVLVVLDNCGLELVCDLVLCDALLWYEERQQELRLGW
jgi:hypothetical protein